MAYQLYGPGDLRPMRASANVTTLSFTSTTNASPGAYASGGIPFGAAIKQDTTTGNPNDVILTAAAGDPIMGIAMAYPAAGPGDSVPVQLRGIAKCIAASAINIGDIVEVANASGQLQTATSASTLFTVGRALTPATAAGDYFSVELMPAAGKVGTP